jgi:hypothetical protein
MNCLVGENGEDRFADGEIICDLRASAGATEPETQLELGDVRERAESGDGLKAFRKNSGEDLGGVALPAIEDDFEASASRTRIVLSAGCVARADRESIDRALRLDA